MADDQGKGAGKQALAPDVLAARAAEQRERDAVAFAEREYDLARQAAAANPDGNGHRLGRGCVCGESSYHLVVDICSIAAPDLAGSSDPKR